MARKPSMGARMKTAACSIASLKEPPTDKGIKKPSNHQPDHAKSCMAMTRGETKGPSPCARNDFSIHSGNRFRSNDTAAARAKLRAKSPDRNPGTTQA